MPPANGDALLPRASRLSAPRVSECAAAGAGLPDASSPSGRTPLLGLEAAASTGCPPPATARRGAQCTSLPPGETGPKATGASGPTDTRTDSDPAQRDSRALPREGVGASASARVREGRGHCLVGRGAARRDACGWRACSRVPCAALLRDAAGVNCILNSEKTEKIVL